VSIGGSISITASFTNPASIDSGWQDVLDVPNGPFGGAFEWDYADINGDDLPDRVVVTGAGIMVQLNLGYGFAPAIKWADGGFENGESCSGSVGSALGFQINDKEFSGGLAFNESIDLWGK
jgi:hypothetical protein